LWNGERILPEIERHLLRTVQNGRVSRHSSRPRTYYQSQPHEQASREAAEQ
jgi:hypothetical protein